jgi:uncharacterized delta-60 repeat protein
MKLLKAILLVPVLLVPVLLVFLAGSALAKTAPRAKLDPHFGRGGSTVVATPLPTRTTPVHLAVAPSNKSYVLQGSTLVAFGANGKPDTGFGEDGRLTVSPKTGELSQVSDLAVDSQGRLLVVGTFSPVPGRDNKPSSGAPEGSVPGDPLYPQPVTEAFVIRYQPNGSLDPTFGSGGEVDSTFGAPRPQGAEKRAGEWEYPVVNGMQIAVDSSDRPVITAKFAAFDQALVTRLNTDGSLDTSFGSGGRAAIPSETSIALAPTPQGGWATLSGGEVCEHEINGFPATLSVLTDTGAPLPTLDPARPTLRAAEGVLAVDTSGRILFTERGEYEAVLPRIIRLLPNGDLDTSFGRGGAVNVKRLGVEKIGAIGLDRRGRIVVGFGKTQFKIGRISPIGALETKFGNHGSLTSNFRRASELQALAFDSKGRIVTAGTTVGVDPKTESAIGIARFLPGA